ncbi:MAG: phosphoribosylformylglycinamidine cyclo-ligase [Actinomycetota bacterium]|jgi:phosphoribosylformylglycinamidine cyclo-ligase|nr:phosphoribosylformylglycinamidine cyclo-ligase [Actinomycetota bacterium]
MSDKSSTYGSVGVDYETLDAAKRTALAQALATSPLLEGHGGRALDESRGETAFVFEFDGRTMAMVLECLGTKSMIAREFQEATGMDRWADIAFDSVAAIANDLCCVGALPLVVNAYFATGSGEWYDQGTRKDSLVAGWRTACEVAGATWGGGESPTLPGLIHANEIDLAGCAIGYVPAGRSPILGDELAPGDVIVLIASTGLHANGASLARKVARDLPEGLQTQLPSGRSLGDALLVPAPIYVELVRNLLAAEAPVTYLSHVTGHGLRKLMRARHDVSYVLDKLPDVPEVLSFLVERLSMDPREAYGTFNMGAGFAVYCRPEGVSKVMGSATDAGLTATVAGRVEAGDKRVVLEPVAVEFGTDDLQLR